MLGEKIINKDVIDLLISIVVYKTPATQIRDVVSYIDLPTLSITTAIVIVDNYGDKKLKEVCKTFGWKYLFSGVNLGFGKGHNKAVKYLKMKHRVHLMLNPDVFISSSSLSNSFSYLVAHDDIALLSPKLLSVDGTIQHICRLIPSPISIIKRVFGHFLGRNNDDYEERIGFAINPVVVPFIHGACIFVRASSFERVRGFDGRYFLYVEDLDLCRELANYGSIIYLPSSTALHLYNKGSYKNIRLIGYHLISFARYFKKWGFFNDFNRKKINIAAIKRAFS